MTGTSDAGPAVRLEEVDVRFDGVSVFENLSLEAEPGELLVIVGRSGCGKTTVLNVVIGFVRPASGHVTVLGHQPEAVRDDIAYMFAHDALLPWRSALRNVEFGLELRKVSRGERRRLSLERLAALGLAGKERLFPRQLSQGMRQRVALARTWVAAPKLLLMDEPFAALDAQTRLTVQRDFLRTWEEQKATVIFVTHDLTEAILMADRVVVMGHGRILDDIRVPFERPRILDELVEDARYRSMLQRLSDALREDVVVAGG